MSIKPDWITDAMLTRLDELMHLSEPLMADEILDRLKNEFGLDQRKSNTLIAYWVVTQRNQFGL